MGVKIVSSFAAAIKDAEKNYIRAAKETVNIVAANARKSAQENISRDFTTRNQFTTKSVLYTQCPPSAKSLNDIYSVAGITDRAGYMERQERGGVKSSGSGKNLVIPTTKARGGSDKNLVRQKYYLSSVKQNLVKGKTKFKSHKAATVARAAVASKQNKFIRMNDAFFRVTNFRAVAGRVRFKLQEILNLKHKTTVTPKKPWLEPAAQAAASDIQAIYNSRMAKL